MTESAEIEPALGQAETAADMAARVVENLASAVHTSPETLRLPLLCL